LGAQLAASVGDPESPGEIRREPTADMVRAELAATLNLSPSPIDLNTALIDLGLDSLLALDLRQRLRRLTGRSMPLATLLGGITAAELVIAVEKMEEAVGD
jgi:mycobactin polyketide synthetase MbtD